LPGAEYRDRAAGHCIPDAFAERDALFDAQQWINPGDAVVVKPFGGVIAGPLHQEKGILYAEVSLEDARNARKSLDVAGHYGRPDIFSLDVDRRDMPPVAFRQVP
jgi:nitrilase